MIDRHSASIQESYQSASTRVQGRRNRMEDRGKVRVPTAHRTFPSDHHRPTGFTPPTDLPCDTTAVKTWGQHRITD